MIRRRLRLAAKRVIDVSVASAGLAALSPLLAGIALLELRYHGWPPFFVQERPGKDGRIFRMVKFRTMTNERGPDGELLPDAQRMTEFGRRLRETSLDELPELINVLKGDMSLVGPRPLLVRYLGRYDERQMRRHEVRPGITGWAQVNGRNALSWPERFEHDVEYVDNLSLRLDLKILLLTLKAVVSREGISEEGQATMTEFLGNED